MNWDNPKERAALVQSVGIEAYNKAFQDFVKETTIITIGGHAIRQVGTTRFGKLFQCGNTDKAFANFSDAEDYAKNNPV